VGVDTVITLVIAAVILVFLIDGIKRGLVRQLFEIAGLIAAFIGAYYFGHFLSRHMEGLTRVSHTVIIFVLAAIVFIAVVFLFHLLGAMLQKVVSVTILSPVDRIGGAVFGVVKGVLLVSLVCVLVFNAPAAAGFRQRLEKNRAAAAIHPLLPRLYHFFIKRSAEGVDSPDFVTERPSRETS